MKFNLLLIIGALGLSGCMHICKPDLSEDCEYNPKRQALKTERLKHIAQEDQKDRSIPEDSIDWNKVSKRDKQRRKEVASIFAEGCFKNTSDYISAALVYQHGDRSDHFYQAFVWANKAVLMGEDSQRFMVAASLDRYLVSIEKKQLFGTQMFKGPDGVWCIQPIEASFDESLRIKYTKASVKDIIKNTLKGIGSDQLPNDIKECNSNLKSTPIGSVPGFW